MAEWTKRIPFQVDIAGVIHIMGSALYSRPDAAIRELIQNAHDAVMRRRQRDLTYQGRIDIRQDAAASTLEFHDDGFGITADDAERYLGTLGIGLTGLLKGKHPSSQSPATGGDGLIGMFGIGLFSAFMLAERVVVESRCVESAEAVRWSAGEGTEIELSSCPRTEPGTLVRLHLKPQFQSYAASGEAVEKIVKEYADFLAVPIFLNGSLTRANVIHSAWLDPTTDREAIELELASYFDESPLDVIPVQIARPAIAGALYVTPQRTPGFADDSVVTATVMRMVISRRIQGLLPEWASFLRGVLELRSCSPTASREDLVKDAEFERVHAALEDHLFAHFETLARDDAPRFESLLSWHRYTWAGAALSEPRVRALLSGTYKFPTSLGLLTFRQIAERSAADPLSETEFDRVVWYNTDRRQEAWLNSLFSDHTAPCVHALRSFEESLLAALAGENQDGARTDLRFAGPNSPNFAADILGAANLEDAAPQWQEHLGETEAKVRVASFRADQPVLAFLNEQHELLRTFADLKQRGAVPPGFQRLIDAHFDQREPARNEVLLNREHRLVARALEQKTSSPLASVLRLLVIQALGAAGGAVPRAAQRRQADDLDWIAECLWGRS
jgi:molecular chaperone HtpG